jgi:hypothetical protein
MEELLMARIDEIFDCTVVGVAAGAESRVSVGVELLDGLDYGEALERRMRAVLQDAGVSCPVTIELVEPGWNEGLTGKKLKRAIRASLGSRQA